MEEIYEIIEKTLSFWEKLHESRKKLKNSKEFFDRAVV